MQRRVAIRDGGATVLMSWGSYRSNWLARKHQEATVDQAEVTVRVDDDREGLATYDQAVWSRIVAARSRQRRRGGSRGLAMVRRAKRG